MGRMSSRSKLYSRKTRGMSDSEHWIRRNGVSGVERLCELIWELRYRMNYTSSQVDFVSLNQKSSRACETAKVNIENGILMARGGLCMVPK